MDHEADLKETLSKPNTVRPEQYKGYVDDAASSTACREQNVQEFLYERRRSYLRAAEEVLELLESMPQRYLQRPITNSAFDPRLGK